LSVTTPLRGLERGELWCGVGGGGDRGRGRGAVSWGAALRGLEGGELGGGGGVGWRGWRRVEGPKVIERDATPLRDSRSVSWGCGGGGGGGGGWGGGGRRGWEGVGAGSAAEAPRVRNGAYSFAMAWPRVDCALAAY